MSVKAIVQFVRVDSKRIQHKMLEKLGAKTLLEHGMDYLNELVEKSGVQLFLAGSLDTLNIIKPLISMYYYEYLLISPEASRSEGWELMVGDISNQLNHNSIRNSDLVWHSNVLCRPFLTKETGLNILRRRDPGVTAIKKRGSVWSVRDVDKTESSMARIGYGNLANTKQNDEYYEFAHLGYIIYANWYRSSEVDVCDRCPPFPVTLTAMEKIDVDYPDDLDLARKVYKAPLSNPTHQ